MNYIEQFAKESTTLDLALYGGVLLIIFVLFKDKIPAIKEYIVGLFKKIKPPKINVPSLIDLDPENIREADSELFFELIKSWKKTRDLAEDYGAIKAVDIADQMFPHLVPNEELDDE